MHCPLITDFDIFNFSAFCFNFYTCFLFVLKIKNKKYSNQSFVTWQSTWSLSVLDDSIFEDGLQCFYSNWAYFVLAGFAINFFTNGQCLPFGQVKSTSESHLALSLLSGIAVSSDQSSEAVLVRGKKCTSEKANEGTGEISGQLLCFCKQVLLFSC